MQFSVRNRDLAGAVEEARRAVAKEVPLPVGYTFDWGGEYKDYLAAREQMKVIAPMTVLLILLILFALYGNLKFPLIILFSVLVTEPVGGLLALWYTHTNFSVSSGLGFVALMGVAVLTSVILYSFINKLRLEGNDIVTATYRRVAAAPAAHHDDRARGLHRPASGCDLHRNRQRFAKTVRHRDRRRTALAAVPVDFPGAGSLCCGGAGRRRPEGLTLSPPARSAAAVRYRLRARASTG